MVKCGIFKLWIGIISLSVISGCSWMNSPDQPKPPAQILQTRLDPNLPYLMVSFSRADGQAFQAFKVIQIWPKTPAGLVWILNGQTIAVKKPVDGQKIFFAVDFGNDFQVGQFSAEKDTAICPTATTPYRLNSICGPNETPNPFVYVFGNPTSITGLF